MERNFKAQVDDYTYRHGTVLYLVGTVRYGTNVPVAESASVPVAILNAAGSQVNANLPKINQLVRHTEKRSLKKAFTIKGKV